MQRAMPSMHVAGDGCALVRHRPLRPVLWLSGFGIVMEIAAQWLWRTFWKSGDSALGAASARGVVLLLDILLPVLVFGLIWRAARITRIHEWTAAHLRASVAGQALLLAPLFLTYRGCGGLPMIRQRHHWLAVDWLRVSPVFLIPAIILAWTACRAVRALLKYREMRPHKV